MQEATVCYLLRGGGDQEELLLGKRSSLFCNGSWNGPGGKKRPSESMRVCLGREVIEEVGVSLIGRRSVKLFAKVNYHHPCVRGHILEWCVHFYVATSWSGEPVALKGFSDVAWFPLLNLPYKDMVSDQIRWLPIAICTGFEELMLVDVFFADLGLETVEKVIIRFENNTVTKVRH